MGIDSFSTQNLDPSAVAGLLLGPVGSTVSVCVRRRFESGGMTDLIFDLDRQWVDPSITRRLLVETFGGYSRVAPGKESSPEFMAWEADSESSPRVIANSRDSTPAKTAPAKVLLGGEKGISPRMDMTFQPVTRPVVSRSSYTAIPSEWDSIAVSHLEPTPANLAHLPQPDPSLELQPQLSTRPTSLCLSGPRSRNGLVIVEAPTTTPKPRVDEPLNLRPRTMVGAGSEPL